MAQDELISRDELNALLDAAPAARSIAGGVQPYDLGLRVPAQDGADLPALRISPSISGRGSRAA